jgi:hypothetical protein
MGGGVRNAYYGLVRRHERRHHFGELGTDGRIIVKYILNV